MDYEGGISYNGNSNPNFKYVHLNIYSYDLMIWTIIFLQGYP